MSCAEIFRMLTEKKLVITFFLGDHQRKRS